MIITDITTGAEDAMKNAVDSLQRELQGMIVGRTDASLLDGLMVDYYGTPMPVNQVASVEIIGGDEIRIEPFAAEMLDAIERAIHAALDARDLEDIPVSNDGEVLTLPVPPLLPKRRAELAKIVATQAAEAFNVVVSARRDAMDKITAAANGKQITEDERQQDDQSVQTLTAKYEAEVQALAKAKEKAIMEPF